MNKLKILLSVILTLSMTRPAISQTWNSKYVKFSEGKLTCIPDEKGNVLPDFSKVGYHKGLQPIPVVKIVKTVLPAVKGESQTILQNAIDEVAKMPVDRDGFRGAILLKKGVYEIPGTIKISADGIILRGEGNAENGTVLIATGKGQRSLLTISGKGKSLELSGTRRKITDSYVPVGTKSFLIDHADIYKAGDHVIILRPGTDKWIHDLKMDQITERPGTKQWQASGYDLSFEREITKIEGNRIYIDIPVVMAMEDNYGGGYIYKYTFDGRIKEVGVENIYFKSDYASETDEDHGWEAVVLNNCENCWVKSVTARFFGYSCVSLGKGSKFVTVTDSKCFDGKSQITGGRRYSFNLNGQMCLVMNCETTEGRHDYVTGSQVCGPNVFYNCRARATHADVGPHHRWAVGTLYDNVYTDGQINVQDRGNMGSGHGWAGANQVLWNCKAKQVAVQNPWVSAKNYCIGLNGGKYEGHFNDRPDGEWEGNNKPGLQPQSLYMAQVAAGKE